MKRLRDRCAVPVPRPLRRREPGAGPAPGADLFRGVPLALVALLAAAMLAAPAHATGGRAAHAGPIVAGGSCGTGGVIVDHRGRGHHHLRDGRRWHWVPGHWSWRTERILVRPAGWRRVWVKPRYEIHVLPCGAEQRVLVQAGHWKRIRTAPRYELRRTRAWIAGRWERVHRPHRGTGLRHVRHRQGRGRHG